MLIAADRRDGHRLGRPDTVPRKRTGETAIVR